MIENDLRYWVKLLEGKEKLELSKLSFSKTALAPIISKKTIDIHYDVLTKAYFEKAEKTGDTFQIAGALLHDLYWKNLQPQKAAGSKKPLGQTAELIDNKFGSFNEFKKEFEEQATTIQGNGWCVLTRTGRILQIPNHKKRDDIILIIDMWEHAYFLDHGADKKKYLNLIWKIINWGEVETRLD